MTNPVLDPLHHPRIKDPEGLICFLDVGRPCEASCMAYITPPDGPDYQDQQFANCMLLVNAHRAGKHLVVLAMVGGELVKKNKTEAADRARAQQTPPPEVR